MLSPAATGFMIWTRPPSRAVCSTITTASEPGGAGAPVMMAAARPGCERGNILGARARLDFSHYFRSRGQAGKIAARTAYPSRMARGNGGKITVASTGSARICPRRLRATPPVPCRRDANARRVLPPGDAHPRKLRIEEGSGRAAMQKMIRH